MRINSSYEGVRDLCLDLSHQCLFFIPASLCPFQGDGAPVPNTHTEGLDDSVMTCNSAGESEGQEMRILSRPFSVKLEVDVMQLLLTLASLLSRTWHLGLPRAVV